MISKLQYLGLIHRCPCRLLLLLLIVVEEPLDQVRLVAAGGELELDEILLQIDHPEQPQLLQARSFLGHSVMALTLEETSGYTVHQRWKL